jgi:hypothetical protein
LRGEKRTRVRRTFLFVDESADDVSILLLKCNLNCVETLLGRRQVRFRNYLVRQACHLSDNPADDLKQQTIAMVKAGPRVYDQLGAKSLPKGSRGQSGLPLCPMQYIGDNVRSANQDQCG